MAVGAEVGVVAAPIVSVIITDTGEARLCRRTVASVLNQTLASVEAVVVGAGHTAAAALVGRLSDGGRGRVVREGLGERDATGTYVMFLDAGQVLERHACMTLYAAAERSGAQLVCGCGERVDDRCELGVHQDSLEFHGPAEGRDTFRGGTPAGRLYLRSFLASAGLWPAEEDHAAKAFAAADDLMVVPHGILRQAHTTVSPGGRLLTACRRLVCTPTSEKVKQVVYGRVLTRLPVRAGSVVLESDSGHRYGGSPRAIYEQLQATGYRGRTIWSHTGAGDDFPAEAARVRRLSWAHYWALARADYWIDDRGLPAHLTKRPQTTYLQAWHGPPVEFVGFDEPSVKLASRADQRRLRRSVDRFDYFIVGSEYEEQTVLAGLGVKAKPLRVGHPRNDLLVKGDDPDRLHRLAAQLGVDRHTTMVLCAPQRPGRALNLDVLAQDLGPGFTLLADHTLLPPQPTGARSGTGTAGAAGSVVDVAAVHDLAALLALTDVLVTDHAPVMFDFALLNRPMIFYVPDPAEHRRHHGTYLDLAVQAPGPLVGDQRELTAAIKECQTSGQSYRAARRQFADRYGTYESGEAAAQIVARFFTPDRAENR